MCGSSRARANAVSFLDVDVHAAPDEGAAVPADTSLARDRESAISGCVTLW